MLEQRIAAMHIWRKAGTNRLRSSCCAPRHCTEAVRCVQASYSGRTAAAGGQDIALGLEVIERLARRVPCQTLCPTVSSASLIRHHYFQSQREVDARHHNFQSQRVVDAVRRSLRNRYSGNSVLAVMSTPERTDAMLPTHQHSHKLAHLALHTRSLPAFCAPRCLLGSDVG